MNSLITVQKWMKAAKIITVIILVACIVGIVFALYAGLTGATFGLIDLVIAGGEGISLNGTQISVAVLCAAAELAVSVVIAILILGYLKKEKAAGTPFTFEGARNIRKIGILALVLPIVVQFICSLIESSYSITSEVGFDVNITLALFLLFLSALFNHGAELSAPQDEEL